MSDFPSRSTDPVLDLVDEQAEALLLEESSLQKMDTKSKRPRIEAKKIKSRHGKHTVTLPIEEWEEMKQQNIRILNMLAQSQNGGDSPRFGASRCESWLGKRKNTEEVDLEADYDDVHDDYDIDGAIHAMIDQAQTQNSRPETVQNQTGENDVMGQLEQEFDTKEVLGDEDSDRVANLITVMAKGQMSVKKFKEKVTEYKRPKYVSESLKFGLWWTTSQRAQT